MLRYIGASMLYFGAIRAVVAFALFDVGLPSA